LNANPEIIRFTEVPAVYEQRLLENNFEDSYISSLKKNLKRKIYKELPGEINFSNFSIALMFCATQVLLNSTLLRKPFIQFEMS